MVSLGQPHDVLEAYAVPAPGGVRLELGPSDTNDDIPTDHTNLAFIAAEKLMVRAGRSGHGVRLVLRKRIPAGAGLGGGSADAAAALLAVRRLLEMDVDDDGVREIAAEVGSDVPFCLHGGAAWMRGRGEIIEPLDLTRGLAFLVAIPPFRLSTPDVYAAWDELGGPDRGAVGAGAPPGRRAGARARQRPRAGGRSRRAAARGVPRRARGHRRTARAARRERLRLRRAGAGRARCCPSSCRRSASACGCPSSAPPACRAACASIADTGERMTVPHESGA